VLNGTIKKRAAGHNPAALFCALIRAGRAGRRRAGHRRIEPIFAVKMLIIVKLGPHLLWFRPIYSLISGQYKKTPTMDKI
jgi:hypothetical protein